MANLLRIIHEPTAWHAQQLSLHLEQDLENKTQNSLTTEVAQIKDLIAMQDTVAGCMHCFV
jgi:hypothetical protein